MKVGTVSSEKRECQRQLNLLRVSLTYDERNGNYNSNKAPFLKIVLPKMEVFTAQCVGRCAGKWTPFGRCAEGAHVGASPAVRQRLRGRARPGHFAPALPVLPVYRRAATCVKRRVDEGPRSLPDSSGEEQRGPQPPRERPALRPPTRAPCSAPLCSFCPQPGFLHLVAALG